MAFEEPSEFMEEDEIGATGHSILLDHGIRTEKAFVLLHGFTASPRQFIELGRRLHERGSNVSIPRLPRHGHADRLTNVLESLTADELAAFALESVAGARALGQRTIVLGFSLGGLLALWLAQHERFERAVAIAPFLGISVLPHRFSEHAARFVLRVPNRFVWWNPLVRERQQPEHGYPRYSTHALAQAYGLADGLFSDARERAPATHQVTLVLNDREMAVNNGSAKHLATMWRAHGAQVELHRLRGLPISHDIIEPLRAADLIERIYPQILDLADP